MFLDGILKGLVLWLYGLILEGVEYMADSLLSIFSLDLAYFEAYAPVVKDIQNIVIAVGWALLIGNLVFQAMRSMAAGLGFEGEDPVALGTRTFVFAFLLLASRQICAIGLNFTSAIMDLFQVPDAVEIITPDENAFSIDSSWLLAMIVGLILIFQVIKFFFEIGERYVVTVILVVLAPPCLWHGRKQEHRGYFQGVVQNVRQYVRDDADECHFLKAAALHHEYSTQWPGDLPLADFRDSHRPGRQEDR